MKVKHIGYKVGKHVFVAMAKIGKITSYDPNVGVVPRVGKDSIEAIKLPLGLLKFKQVDPTVFWDYAGDSCISKFQLTFEMNMGPILHCVVKILDTEVEFKAISLIYNNLTLPLINLSNISVDELIKVSLSDDFEYMVSFVKKFYPLNDAQESELRS